MRTIPEGITGERQQFAGFATSALDGRSSWLELPGFSRRGSGWTEGVAVSPDGRWLGWVRSSPRRVKGWAIKDTRTGAVRHLDVDGHPRIFLDMSGLTFSGDSRYLLTTFETAVKAKGRRGRQGRFVAWRVEDGTAIDVEAPGTRGPGAFGSAGTGVVWSRGSQVFRSDLTTGRRSVVTLPRIVQIASWAPGDAAFAYVGRPVRKKGQPPPDERLYVGASPGTAHRAVKLPLTSPIGELLTWRDATHVVVGNYRGGAHVIDITDGSYQTLDLTGAGELLNPAQLASGLWAQPLREPEAPIGTSDPRRPWRWVGLFAFAALLAGGAAVLRRADRAARRRAPHLQVNEGEQS
ncbi:hypothetical protein ACLM5J_09170 [Nocardioides sp. Bht2]|uniref:hypothetical protein n=1 Tax=Nocardioides sp. Bht2 TaxID=3392297 RepID=UPI0039B4B7E4